MTDRSTPFTDAVPVPAAADPAPLHVADSVPYAWPWDGRLGGHHLALVLAGWDEAWAARVVAPQPHLAAIALLARATLAAGGLVVPVAHGGAAALAAPVLDPAHEAVRPVAAVGLDAFHGSPLDPLLRAAGRTHLLVVGQGLEGPVHSTLRSANDRGYECLLVTDAAASLTDDLAAASAHTVTMSGGIFGAIGVAEAVLAALAPTPVPHPHPTLAEEAPA